MRYWKRIPPLKSLLALEAAARHASFTRAADELNVSQSAVSHAITTAETFLGAQLINRSTRPISLTPEGKAYVATLANCFTQLAAEADGLRRRRAADVLTISCNLAYGNYWLLPRLKGFHAAHPDLQVNMVTTYQGLASLDEGIDVAIRFGRGDWPGREARLLFRERIVPVASPDYVERNAPVRSAGDLLSHDLLHALSVERSWYDWQQWFEQFGVTAPNPLPWPMFDNHLLMMQAALSGRGVALGWIGTASDFLRQGLLVKVLDVPIVLDEGLYVVVRRQRDRRIERFLDWITDCAGSEAAALEQPFRGA
ncbi:LysR substrate-binding domain-containing protein [Albidovulum sediminicola]|uniref:LysR substrate-binding domain-containing protein n=1 Tax=Albidovulum sediminicola TaxID=2984331 RepID=A0ABT2Z6K3_9RHOB|nr:LysR substrate-binding domain-containing protein [Defluviimonas sp. WL0075]MCV2866773.1 LysR substrate-binding domain-containing protein [Defluviimonas sp. WL0075]